MSYVLVSLRGDFFAERENIKNLMLNAVAAVFSLMALISYLMLSIVTDGSKRKSRLKFNDQVLLCSSL